MSYKKTYHDTIEVRESRTVTINYPASQNGGSTSETVYFEKTIPVEINLDVDTRPFDQSVEACKSSINILTGTVAATQTAQIASIYNNSKKIAGTVISGFFSYIGNEIQQQITELSENIDAQLKHLKKQAQMCEEKKADMKRNYHRISDRYRKLFGDLNNELKNRIHELDKPAFLFHKECDRLASRTSCDSMVSTVAVCGKESMALQARISASSSKQCVLNAIGKARGFLIQHKLLGKTIQSCMTSDKATGFKYVPVAFLEAIEESESRHRAIYAPQFASKLQEPGNQETLKGKFQANETSWSTIAEAQSNKVKEHFLASTDSAYSGGDEHSQRVKQMILRLAQFDSIKVTA